jgi:hypothetical protein
MNNALEDLRVELESLQSSSVQGISGLHIVLGQSLMAHTLQRCADWFATGTAKCSSAILQHCFHQNFISTGCLHYSGWVRAYKSDPEGV